MLAIEPPNEFNAIIDSILAEMLNGYHGIAALDKWR
jgi:hypothetical protein